MNLFKVLVVLCIVTGRTLASQEEAACELLDQTGQTQINEIGLVQVSEPVSLSSSSCDCAAKDKELEQKQREIEQLAKTVESLTKELEDFKEVKEVVTKIGIRSILEGTNASMAELSHTLRMGIPLLFVYFLLRLFMAH